MSRCSRCLRAFSSARPHGPAPAAVEAAQQADGQRRPEPTDGEHDPPQVGCQRTAEAPDGGRDEEDLLIAVGERQRRPATVERQVPDAGAEEVGGILLTAQVQRVLEVGERLVVPASNVRIGAQRALGVDHVARRTRVVAGGEPQRALLVEEVDDDEGLGPGRLEHRRGPIDVRGPAGAGEPRRRSDPVDDRRVLEVVQDDRAVPGVAVHERRHDALEDRGVAARRGRRPGRALQRRPHLADRDRQRGAGLVRLLDQQALLVLVGDDPAEDGQSAEHDDTDQGRAHREAPLPPPEPRLLRSCWIPVAGRIRHGLTLSGRPARPALPPGATGDRGITTDRGRAG